MPLSPYAGVFGFDVSLKLYSHKAPHYFWFAGGYSWIFNFWASRNIFSFIHIIYIYNNLYLSWLKDWRLLWCFKASVGFFPVNVVKSVFILTHRTLIQDCYRTRNVDFMIILGCWSPDIIISGINCTVRYKSMLSGNKSSLILWLRQQHNAKTISKCFRLKLVKIVLVMTMIITILLLLLS